MNRLPIKPEPRIERGAFRPQQAAEYLGVSLSTLRDLTHPRGPIRRTVLGPRTIRYSRAELDRVIEEHMETE